MLATSSRLPLLRHVTAVDPERLTSIPERLSASFARVWAASISRAAVVSSCSSPGLKFRVRVRFRFRCGPRASRGGGVVVELPPSPRYYLITSYGVVVSPTVAEPSELERQLLLDKLRDVMAVLTVTVVDTDDRVAARARRQLVCRAAPRRRRVRAWRDATRWGRQQHAWVRGRVGA